jgi:putative peptidoglycan lipid II flippase
MLVLTLPILLGNTIQTIDHLVNRILASELAEGSMAALNYSNKLSIFLVGVVSLGAGTVCYTKMSELGAKQEVEELKQFLRTVINLLNLIVVPASIGMMVLNVPLIKLTFEYGAFDSQSSEITSVTLWYYSIGLVGFVLRDIITKAFYALNDSKIPMINGGIAVGIGIVANVILVGFMGVGGLALATSISGIIGTLLLLVSLRRKLGQIGLRDMSLTFFKTLFAGGLMGLAVHGIYQELYGATERLLLSVVISILCGILVYGGAILLLGVKEAAMVVTFLQKKK